MKAVSQWRALARITSRVALVLLIGTVSGCQTTHDYGAPPVAYEAAVTEYVRAKVKDPYTAVVRVEGASKGWYREWYIFKARYGFIVSVSVKERGSRGYGGEDSYCIFMRDGHIVKEVNIGFWACFSPEDRSTH